MGASTWKLAKVWQTPIVGELFQLLASGKMMKQALDRENPFIDDPIAVSSIVVPFLRRQVRTRVTSATIPEA